jgi:DNA-binding IclR family transcriptional regulator
MKDAGETVNLGIEGDDEAVDPVQGEGRRMVRALAGPGSQASPPCSAMEKALLAAMRRESGRFASLPRRALWATSTA